MSTGRHGAIWSRVWLGIAGSWWIGTVWSAPFGVCPVGLQGLIWPGACEALARAVPVQIAAGSGEALLNLNGSTVVATAVSFMSVPSADRRILA